MPSPQVWFITGSSSGFGRHITELVLQNGDTAIATLRDPAALSDLTSRWSPDRLFVLKLDVSKPQDILDAFAEAKRALGQIDVVFNNAGYGVLSEVESAPDDVVRSMFDVNFWGAANVTRAAVNFFREVNKPPRGRLLQVSSSGGVQGFSALGYYSASKFALEGLTEALVAELRPEWNIKVTLIKPGGFRTNAGRSMVRTTPHPAYIDPTLRLATARNYLQVNPRMPGDANKAAHAIFRLAALPDPPLHFPLGKDAIEAVKGKAERLHKEAESFKDWSQGLELRMGVDAPRL